MAVNISISSWAPPGENAYDLAAERMALAGVILGGVSYGLYLSVYFKTFLNQLRSKRKKVWQIVYLNTMMLFATLYFGTTHKWIQQMFIDYRNYHLDNVTTDPELTGPLGFYNLDYAAHSIVIGNAAYVVLNFMSDGLLIYRTYLIWNRNWLVLIFPMMIYLAQTALSIVTVWNNSLVGSNFLGAKSREFATSWVVLSMSLNVILCALIFGRIFSTRRRLVAAYGERTAKSFTSVAAIVIESAALYSFVSLLFLSFYELPSTNISINFINILLPQLTMAMVTAPTLILLRVARNKAFSRETAMAAVSGVGSSVPLEHMHADLESRGSALDDKNAAA